MQLGPENASPSPNQPYKKEKNYGTGKRRDKRAHPFVAHGDIEHAEQPAAKQSSEHADDHIADDTKTATFDDQTGKPTGHGTD
jgi:hypothetical protein